MTKTTSLLAKYIGLYEKNPTGQVFAPLAETYRKLGMHKEAMDVLKKGLRHHPHYILGLIVLAHCHFDQGHLEQAYRILSPIVGQEQDNLMLQKLYAQISYKLYAYKDALQSYKNILFVNPTDEEAKIKIKELEEQEQNYYAYMKQGDAFPELPKPSPSKPLSVEDLGEWKELDQQQEVPRELVKANDQKVSDYLKNVSVDDAQSWTVKQWSVPTEKMEEVLPEIIPESIAKPVVEHEKTEDVLFPQEFTNSSPSSSINLDSYQTISPTEEIPIVTHTLIDIFCAQKHYDKALELLDKVLKHDPLDERSKQKRQYVLSKMQDGKPVTAKKTIATTVAPIALKAEVVVPKEKSKDANWNEAKYNMLSQRYGKLLDQLKDLGKSH